MDQEKLEKTPREKTRRGPGAMMAPAEKAKDFKGTLLKIMTTLEKEKYIIIIAMIISIISTVFAIVGPKILGNATEEMFQGVMRKVANTGGIDIPKIQLVLKEVLLLYIISAACEYVEGYLMSIATQKYTYRLRKALEEKIHKLPFSYFDKRQRGETLSIITNDVDTLQMCFNQSITQAITSITTVIGVLIMMLTINIPMTFIALLILPISLLFIGLIVKKSQGYFVKNQDNLGHVNGAIEEMFSGQNIVSSFNAEERLLSDFSKNNQELYITGWKSQFFGGLMQPVMISISNFGYVAIAILGGYNIINGSISVGNLQSFISYTKNFTRPLTSIAQVFNQIQSMIAAAERIFNFLEEKEEVFAKAKESTDHIKGNVEFKNVNFGYTKDKTIINNFNAKVKKGEKVAIVGPTGAGKTTMVKLLMHFYNINSGEILIDGLPVDNYDVHELRKSIAMVLQDTWLFSGTIRENLRYGRLDATDEEIYDAARIANADDFIRTLPDGYDTVIDEDINNISQGQKQLLTIARAVLSNSKLLILDEATSSVDTRTEELIQASMDKLMEGRTSFIIAHRLSTIKNADLILVMNEGDIIESGTHDELLKKKGFYANLYNSQFEK